MSFINHVIMVSSGCGCLYHPDSVRECDWEVREWTYGGLGGGGGEGVGSGGGLFFASWDPLMVGYVWEKGFLAKYETQL